MTDLSDAITEMALDSAVEHAGLREQLVTAIGAVGPRWVPRWLATRMAEAVIASLALRPEWSVGDDGDGRVLWDDGTQARTEYPRYRADGALERRWITPWRPA